MFSLIYGNSYRVQICCLYEWDWHAEILLLITVFVYIPDKYWVFFLLSMCSTSLANGVLSLWIQSEMKLVIVKYTSQKKSWRSYVGVEYEQEGMNRHFSMEDIQIKHTLMYKKKKHIKTKLRYYFSTWMMITLKRVCNEGEKDHDSWT